MQLSKANLNAQHAAAQIAEIAQLIWDKGWAEGGGGNLSVNVTEHYPGIDMDFRSFPMIPIKIKYNHIAGHYIFVTTKGSRMRNLAKTPGSNLCLIKVAQNGEGFQVLFEDPENRGIPTSELPSHLAIHNLLAGNGGKEKAIVHTHAHELIALTHFPEFKNEKSLNDVLLRIHSETVFFLPAGIGFIPFEVPGSEALAGATLNSLVDHKVVLWEKHGCLAVGEDVHQAFDRVDMFAKAAGIYLECLKTGKKPELLSYEQIEQIRSLIQG